MPEGAGRADIAASGYFDLPGWWGAPGSPGMLADEGPITGAPWVWAGHVRGAWRLREPTRAPDALPFPGVRLAATPLPLYDSVAVVALPFAGGTLAEGAGLPGALERRRARSVLALRNGSLGLDESVLGFERGDSSLWVRTETSNSRRGGVGGWDGLARHVWGLAGGASGGGHGVSAAFAQQSGAARLTGGEQQSSSGESGALAWHWRGTRASAGIALARGHDFHESTDEFFLYSRRDAQENRVTLRGALERGGARWSGALAWNETRVDRTYDGAAAAAGRGLWGRAAWERPAGEGTLVLTLGAGRHPRAGGFHASPGLAWTFGDRAAGGSVFFERITEPVWTDLAPGQAAFLQSTWTGGLAAFAADAEHPRTRRGVLRFRFGQTASRALASRRPVDDLWLRDGFRADTSRFSFGLLEAGGGWALRAIEAEAHGFALLRDRTALQAQVDPGLGLRARLGTRFSAFTGDLGVRLRVEAAAVGPRESEATPVRRLPGYVTFGAGASLTLADAVFTIELLNLEDRRRPQVWIDWATGVEALGPGRMMRAVLTWRLFD